MKLALTLLAACAVVLALGQDAEAQNSILTASPTSFQYPSADPDTTPVVTSPTITLAYKVAGNPRGTWQILIRAQGDMLSGSDSIPASNVSWSATGTGMLSGTLGTSDQPLATGAGNLTATAYGYLTFKLKNLWTYRAGTYSHTIVFTLVVP